MKTSPDKCRSRRNTFSAARRASADGAASRSARSVVQVCRLAETRCLRSARKCARRLSDARAAWHFSTPGTCGTTAGRSTCRAPLRRGPRIPLRNRSRPDSIRRREAAQSDRRPADRRRAADPLLAVSLQYWTGFFRLWVRRLRALGTGPTGLRAWRLQPEAQSPSPRASRRSE